MPGTSPGEIWMIDLGYTAKVRPCLILSDYPDANDLALLVIGPHTTAVRGNKWEFNVSLPFLNKALSIFSKSSQSRWLVWNGNSACCRELT